jgi:hypothetical protein
MVEPNRLTAGEFAHESRREIQVKGQGAMRTWFILGRTGQAQQSAS